MLYLILSVIFYSLALMLSAFASRHANSNLVTGIINSISAVIPIAIVISIFNKKLVENGKTGIIVAILAGISIAIFTLMFNKSFQVNKVALVTPVVLGGAIFLTAVLSFFIFKEKLPTLHIAGLAIVALGLLTIIYSAATTK